MRIRGLLLTLAALLALVALACADGDDGGAPAPTTGSPAAGQSPSPAAAFAFDCAAEFPGGEPDAGAFPVELIDDAGQSLVLARPPAAIAALSAGHTEMLFALGAGDQVAAADNFSNCPAAAAALPHIDAFSPSAEAIVAMEPDLVILYFDPGGLRESLEGAGINVLFLASPESVEGVFDHIELLGRAAGHAHGAGELIAIMREGIDAVTANLSGVESGPSVFHELDSTYFTAGPGSFIGDLYELLKAENIAAATGQPYAQMSAEAIIAADPQVIVLADEDAGESPETVAARPGWSEIAAVREGRVYVVDPDVVSRPGPRLVEALATLARLLYPEAFP